MSAEKVSNCCGVPAVGNAEDYGICPECKEHCEFVPEEDEVEEPARPINDMNDPETARAARYLDKFREPEGGW